MTQQQCGNEAGISQQHLAIIEGGSDLKVSTLLAIAQALNVRPENLLKASLPAESPAGILRA